MLAHCLLICCLLFCSLGSFLKSCELCQFTVTLIHVVFSHHSTSEYFSASWNQSRKMSPSNIFLKFWSLLTDTFLETAEHQIPAPLSTHSQNPQLPVGNSATYYKKYSQKVLSIWFVLVLQSSRDLSPKLKCDVLDKGYISCSTVCTWAN